MVLKSEDLLIALKFQANRSRLLSTTTLARELRLSVSSVSTSLRRAVAAQLLSPSGLAPTKGRPIKRLIVNRASLTEFLLHGVRYVFIPERGKLTRGMPTAHAASPLKDMLSEPGSLPVWPDAKGDVRGEGFSPIHSSVVHAARHDAALYELLALIDGIRSGSARVRELASRMLAEKLQYG